MQKIDELGNIEVTQGDNLTIPLVAYTDETHSEVYFLKENEYFALSVRIIAGSEPVIYKTNKTQDDSGGFSFDFLPEETAALTRAEYIYDVALMNDSGDLKNTFLGGEERKRTLRVV